MKRRNFLLGLIATPLAAALAKVPLPQLPPLVKPLQRRPSFAMGRQETPFSEALGAYDDRIEVVERWTREGGIRRIGNGAWERIEPWGVVPFVPFIVPPGVTHWQTTKWISPEERAAAQTFAQGPR